MHHLNIIIGISIIICFAEAVPVLDHSHHRYKRNNGLKTQSPDDRDSCKPGVASPVTRVNTTERLRALRDLFTGNGIDGYIIPSGDAHQSEYPSDYDLRRGYISGFSGSAGTAIVLKTKAALWTDGRYYLAAEDELDCNWILMRAGESDTPTMTKWLIDNLGATNGTVGASPFFTSSSSWLSMESTLKEGTVNMKQITNDLIDQIWTTGRPSEPNSTINALPMEYAGRSWQDKITDMHTAMAEQNVDTLIVTGLDETAWLFNLRAKDIAFNPFFISYAIVDRKNSKTRLFLNDKNRKLTENSTDDATKQKLHLHLNTGNTGNCNGMSGPCVEVVDYSTMLTEVQNINTDSGISQVWVAFQCNYALYSALRSKKVHQANTPAALIKTRKNAIEQQGMRNSHKRDAVALITFIANLEKTMKDGTKEWTEVSAALDLKEHRLSQEKNRGLSFSSISAVGSNGAIIHYHPSADTDKKLSLNEMYLLDSGGQYLDGTTDVTRTFHFGSPTAYQKECYTRVLMGQVDLARFKFYKGPHGPYGREIDAIARRPLWDVGLEYRHGTGHGIGSYLSVHEGPGRISLSHASFDSDEKLDEFMFFSDEPGYYEAGQFGIRLENIVMVTEAETTYNFMNSTFLTFETVTLVPYEPNLIDYDLLSPEQIKWINTYHSKVQKEIGPLVSSDPVASEWLSSRTQIVMGRTNMGDNLHTNLVFLVLCAILTTLL
ncbi:xaa-Pro aminopeptidase 1-like isoform X2 [Mytilus galloprovincialis]|uniref:xaa-Pro aminopeptidase 1-like isoform X2 n=1 Tax=Mytilus galloprovincialis TaxID=29158 RepID=UPI003F7B65ED